MFLIHLDRFVQLVPRMILQWHIGQIGEKLRCQFRTSDITGLSIGMYHGNDVGDNAVTITAHTDDYRAQEKSVLLHPS